MVRMQQEEEQDKTKRWNNASALLWFIPLILTGCIANVVVSDWNRNDYNRIVFKNMESFLARPPKKRLEASI